MPIKDKQNYFFAKSKNNLRSKYLPTPHQPEDHL
jgi:hypothetical protein